MRGIQRGVANGKGTVVTVGSFDGVHLGHRAVLQEIARRARATDRTAVLVTFDPHPLVVVNPGAAPPLLTTGAERREILATTELDWVVFLHFTPGLAELAPERFVRDVLWTRYGMRELVIGPDHGFGKGRRGDVELLRALGGEMGFRVDVVDPVVGDGAIGPVSSTRIRRAIMGGDLAGAARMLGRPYQVSARVGRGAGRGRTIGVPTLNLADISPRKLLPPDGVYAVRVEWRGGVADGMMNQGPRPTFGEPGRVLEAHLFDFSRDLYDEWVRVEWVRRLRPTRTFGSMEELRRQLADDREQAVAALAPPRS